ncbi:translation elongation factor Ts [Methylocella silvestris BL2]|uniref:Elongation factor Ts n=1 Tax=Methylocella silvestris (strain DSM 15510 / CIP 108128 / LMG 27833 / NCIMB 13906 / BL2) TaxID=395965 RepID=EFTS_METSB|nr:translation elongation factor Ts [Methylocella silvestris]B8EKA0.1 RecName: Full=Elongation factor Ts; Short=EF-Ts [Methylocella silvestris BL2]ACK50640.1 translation elongation factor Ts [Methylocella silvestris BL2]
MASVTAAMVKDLREKTGAGMMDCKNALNETGGDIEAAIDWLRKKGLSKAAKKSGRIAAEGLVAVAVHETDGVVVEVNSETDFVARNEEFQALARTIALVAVEKGLTDVEALKGAHYPGGSTVAEAIANSVATIGENMTLRRVAAVNVAQGVVGQYVHNAVADGLGKIGVIVGLESTGDAVVLAPLARLIALHIAAASPLALEAADLDPAVVAREKAVLADKNAGKPPQVLEKIVESGLKTFYKEVCLVDQPSIHADHANKTIGQVVKEAEKAAGAPVKLKAFVRYALGEGIEKQESDFAAEVAAAASGQL